MKRSIFFILMTTSGALLATPRATAQSFGLSELSKESKACVDCHRKESPGLYQQWGSSKHFRGNVGCFECHAAQKDDPDAHLHYDQYIAIAVSPKDCARCHEREVAEFTASRHSRAAHILGSLDNVLAEVVEGNQSFITAGFPGGNAASAVTGCWQCHGSVLKVLPDGRLDPATWPNTGIGRMNPDGSLGSCTACHSRHAFSVAQARHPNTCGRCHMGPDHPQKEIYEESKHGIAFFANIDKMNLDSAKWIVGEDYWAAPTCATCHMSQTKNQMVTHDVGMRISWNNRPELSIRTDAADAKMGLPGKDVPWSVRRDNMQDVCMNCHNKLFITNFYTQYDGLISLYTTKFAKPGLELYELAKPLLKPEQFANRLDFIWYELWHHEGRRARHGASMMGADYTHWHGMYEVAKHWYSEFIPELQSIANEHMKSSERDKVIAAEALSAKIESTLKSADHRWFIGEMDPIEAKRRKQAAEEFQKRY